MPPLQEQSAQQRYQEYFLNIALFISFILVFYVFRNYLSIILLAFVLVIIFRPIFLFIHNRTGKHEVLSALLATLSIIIIVLVPLTIFGSILLRELQSALNSPNNVLVNFSSIHVPGIVQRFNVDFKTYITNLFDGFIGDVGTVFSNIATFFVYTVLTIIAIVYFFKDGVRIKDALFHALPFTKDQRIRLTNDLADGVRAVIGGYILVAGIQAVVSGVGYTIFGIHDPVLWAFIVFIAALLPTFGSALVNIPIIIYLFATHRTGAGIGFGIWYMVSVGVIDNFIGPRFIAGRVNIHPLLVILSVLGGLSVFGPIGVVVGPLILIVFWSILQMFREREEEQGALKNT